MSIDFNRSEWPNEFAAQAVVVERVGHLDGYEVRLNGFVLRAFPAEPQALKFAAQVRSALAAPVKTVAIEACSRCIFELDQVAHDCAYAGGRRALDTVRQHIGRWA